MVWLRNRYRKGSIWGQSGYLGFWTQTLLSYGLCGLRQILYYYSFRFMDCKTQMVLMTSIKDMKGNFADWGFSNTFHISVCTSQDALGCAVITGSLEISVAQHRGKSLLIPAVCLALLVGVFSSVAEEQGPGGFCLDTQFQMTAACACWD